MASSRRTGTNENVSTYGTGKNYVEGELAAWEAATDLDLVAASQSEVLEVYNEEFDDYIGTVASGVGDTDASYFRIVRPASGEFGTGVIGSGPRFYYTTSAFWCQLDEDYFSFQDIEHKLTVALSGLNVIIHMQSDEADLVGCILANSVTTNDQDFYGYAQNSVGNTNYMINTLVANNDGDGNTYAQGNFNGTCYVYNATLLDNSGKGADDAGLRNNNGTMHAKNVSSEGHDSNEDIDEFSGTINITTSNPSIADNPGSTPTYADAGGGDYRLAVGDTVCRGNGTDLSADGARAFDDDVGFYTRVAWDIGFAEFQAAVVTGNPWNYYAQQ